MVLIPVRGETVAVANSGIKDEGAMHIGKMRVLGYEDNITPPGASFDYPTPPPVKDTDDYLFQFYMGSLTVVGLLILFRFIQKT